MTLRSPAMYFLFHGRYGPLWRASADRPNRHRHDPGFDISKASPKSVARAIFDAVENGEDDIFPDPMSASVADSWRSGAAKALTRANAAFVHQ